MPCVALLRRKKVGEPSRIERNDLATRIPIERFPAFDHFTRASLFFDFGDVQRKLDLVQTRKQHVPEHLAVVAQRRFLEIEVPAKRFQVVLAVKHRMRRLQHHAVHQTQYLLVHDSTSFSSLVSPQSLG